MTTDFLHVRILDVAAGVFLGQVVFMCFTMSLRSADRAGEKPSGLSLFGILFPMLISAGLLYREWSA